MKKILLFDIYEHVKKQPDKLCLVSVKHELTYRQYWIAICRGAQKLKEAGIKPHDRLCLYGEQSITFLMTLSSAHLLGVTTVPLEKDLPRKRMEDILNRMDTVWVAGRRSSVDGIETSFCYEELEKLFFDNVFCTEADQPDSLVPSEFYDISEDDIQDILFTTGTTGEPKGIMLSFKSVYAVVENILDSVDQNSNDFEILTNPVGHGGGLRRFYSALLAGGTVGISAGSVFQEELFELLEKYPVTAVFLVPSQLSILLKYKMQDLLKYRNQLKYIELGTTTIIESDTRKLTEAFPNVRIYNVYGTSEAGCTCAVNMQEHGVNPRCIGKPTVNSTFYFADEDGLLFDADSEHPGYIVVSGPIVMAGYWEDPEHTAKALKGGKIYTEDFGYRGDDGLIYMLGRKSDVITCGGNKIAPSEVEDCMLQSGLVKECACVPKEDAIVGQIPEMYVVMNEDHEFDEADLLKYLQDRLELFKVPKALHQIDKLPRSSNGKVLKKLLIES